MSRPGEASPQSPWFRQIGSEGRCGHDRVARGSVAVWALLEVSLRVRDRARGMGRTDRDAGTRILIGAAIGAAIVSSAEAPGAPRVLVRDRHTTSSRFRRHLRPDGI